MLLVDDILLSPARGLLFIAGEIYKAARQHSADEAQAVRNELRDLYLMLEAKKISEAGFAAREGELLDRLDALEAGTHSGRNVSPPPEDESETPA